MIFLATAARGTEAALREELRELGFDNVKGAPGGAAFDGEREDGWRACLTSRIAQRVQTPVARFNAESADELYAGVKAIPWETWLHPGLTFAVSAFIRDTAMNHSGFVALKVKDGIVDRLRDIHGDRPGVDREDPDITVFVYWVSGRVIVYLDLAGGSLALRGWRTEAGEAPLRESLAAAILRLSGWDRKTPLMDPMCGAGTIAIEAALLAGNQAPGLARKQFGFERWADFSADDAAAMNRLRGQLRSAAHGQHPRIKATDIDPDVLKKARSNARRAGVRLTFKQRDGLSLQAGEGTFLITNPPYGVRIGGNEEDMDTFQRDLAATLCRLHGWRVCVLTANPGFPKLIPPRPTALHMIKNGDLDCGFLVYDMP
ncbi:MAG: THUMP domain-containing protein [Lentisphaeria bacterium]|nr:THUMP domain-containing protein [Lentisphaeria bacterium]